MTRPTSNSSGQRISPLLKLQEALRQFLTLMRRRNPFKQRDFSYLERVLAEYRTLAEQRGLDLETARSLEIGCGQRPYRLFYLVAHGLDVRGIELDKVVLSLGLGDLSHMLRRNGVERTLKTMGRYVLFDIAENRQFRRVLSDIFGKTFPWSTERIVHGSAADEACWPEGKFGFVYSEDVFEHIPPEDLEKVCAVLAARLEPDGIAVIRPMVFTGIRGGHNVEWYNARPGRNRRCPPWDHLREHRFPANTYLNRLTRADYRALFERHFEILSEDVRDPDMGRVYLTPDVARELADWDEDELFSNQVRFILRPKGSGVP